MTPPDALALDATFHRTALLLGLTRGESVIVWAESVIAREDAPPHALLELAMVPAGDLSALRHALWPLCIDPEPMPVIERVLALVHDDLASERRSLDDTVTVLRQLRSMVRMPRPLYDAINVTLVDHASIGVIVSPVPAWLAAYARVTPAGDTV